ncbi:hypothetical protein A8L34_22435 [Bacillus sp. FJAT-27264]|uniref:hypothetical protein n=1 Tax=Paenibacillus sp. (strain DSM 101736 / FJAT-27264) TaxID=1850362 RepID=UPI000807CF8C|nr:hypothetical protein [Bacillus sp. FJAT-27264]OBZ08914.1 hypothetical protein A8L34_22435 [Bacillus sp. FJAT-27264]
MTERNSIREINKVCKAVLKLQDGDFVEMEGVYKGQESYSHPLKNATAAKQNQLGAYNRRVTEALKNLRSVLESGAEKKEDEAPFGSYAAHQPGYDKFKESGKLDDYAYQSLVHMQTASHHLSWALTVLDHADIPVELREEVQKFVRQTGTISAELQDWMRTYTK